MEQCTCIDHVLHRSMERLIKDEGSLADLAANVTTTTTESESSLWRSMHTHFPTQLQFYCLQPLRPWMFNLLHGYKLKSISSTWSLQVVIILVMLTCHEENVAGCTLSTNSVCIHKLTTEIKNIPLAGRSNFAAAGDQDERSDRGSYCLRRIMGSVWWRRERAAPISRSSISSRTIWWTG